MIIVKPGLPYLDIVHAVKHLREVTRQIKALTLLTRLLQPPLLVMADRWREARAARRERRTSQAVPVV